MTEVTTEITTEEICETPIATVCLDIEKRDATLNPRQLRATGKLPATIYGKGMESISVQLDRKIFALAYRNNKKSIYELKCACKDEPIKTVIRHLQYNYATMAELNIEFYAV